MTGESHARIKDTAALNAGDTEGAGAHGDHVNGVNGGAAVCMRTQDSVPLADCKNMVFMGTLACGGHARAVVTATGEIQL